MDEPETQISGLTVLSDYCDISMRYVTILDLNSFGNYSELIETTGTRLKDVYLLGLPAIANSFFDLLKSFLSNKIKKRLKLCKNIEDLSKVLDVKNLTIEYGGTENIDDCLMHYRQKLEKSTIKWIKFIKSIEVDEAKMKNYENEKVFEGVGSFRKLEVD